MSHEQSRKPGSKKQTRDCASAKRELVRGEPVVQRVLLATVEELARVGYRALRVEDVAARAEVNKTTVYRRWPEKIALLRDALSCLSERRFLLPDTGALRGDLLALGRRVIELWSSPDGQSIVRMLVAEGSDPEVADLKRSMRKTHEAVPLAVIAAAVARGELAADFDHHLLFGAFMGCLHHRLFFMNEKVTPTFLEGLVDLLLAGARRGCGADPAPPADRPARPTPAPRAGSAPRPGRAAHPARARR